VESSYYGAIILLEKKLEVAKQVLQQDSKVDGFSTVMNKPRRYGKTRIGSLSSP